MIHKSNSRKYAVKQTPIQTKQTKTHPNEIHAKPETQKLTEFRRTFPVSRIRSVRMLLTIRLTAHDP